MSGQLFETVRKSAVVSDDGRYRYVMTRVWGSGRWLGWILLNPSTADADLDDMTTRRMTEYARREGCDGIAVVNLFAFRARQPTALWAQPEEVRVGPDNDAWLHKFLDLEIVDKVVLGWGAPRRAWPRVEAVEGILRSRRRTCYCLAVTADGQPGHPLYLPKELPLTEYAL